MVLCSGDSCEFVEGTTHSTMEGLEGVKAMSPYIKYIILGIIITIGILFLLSLIYPSLSKGQKTRRLQPMRRYRRDSIWDKKEDALDIAKGLKKTYEVKIKQISYPSNRKQKGYGVYKLSKR